MSEKDGDAYPLGDIDAYCTEIEALKNTQAARNEAHDTELAALRVKVADLVESLHNKSAHLDDSYRTEAASRRVASGLQLELEDLHAEVLATAYDELAMSDDQLVASNEELAVCTDQMMVYKDQLHGGVQRPAVGDQLNEELCRSEARLLAVCTQVRTFAGDEAEMVGEKLEERMRVGRICMVLRGAARGASC
jgi:hypothetical protein